MRLTVEVVAKTGKGFKANGQWYNRAKGARFTDFSGLNKGDQVEAFVDNGCWVTDYTVMTNGGTMSSAPVAEHLEKSAAPAVKESQYRTPAEIIRQEAVAAVLGSPVVAAMFKDRDSSETAAEVKKMIEEMTNYSVTGAFKKEGN